MNILLAEDDHFLCTVYTDQLQKAGYTILSADDGEKALEVLKSEHVDMILCDVLMPKMDGFAFLEAAHQQDVIKETPVIMLTNVDSDEDRKRATALGVKDYFLKNGMAIDELVQLVRILAPLNP
jgi:two-component system OmpR family response regulator